MNTFNSTESIEIRGRGTIYYVELPDKLIQEHDPRTLLKGSVVKIDGSEYTVKGVETYGGTWLPGRFKKVGLLV